jgi:hypothetical protein
MLTIVGDQVISKGRIEIAIDTIHIQRVLRNPKTPNKA